ncbi:MAG: CHAT domain-containing protein [Acidobacteriota bacterium]
MATSNSNNSSNSNKQQEQQQQQQQQQRPSPVFEISYEEQLARQAVQVAIDAQPRPRRFTSLNLYRGGRKKENAFNPASPLQEGIAYQLEVAIRYTLSPIPTVSSQAPVSEPAQKQPVRILVALEGSGFFIPQPVQALVLPPEGESAQNAWFQVTPLAKSGTAVDVAAIRVRLYVEFNLLDVLVLRAEVVGKFDEAEASAFGTAQPITIQQDRRAPESMDLEHVLPRSMHIDVSREGSGYTLHFAFRNEVNRELALTGTVHLQATDLEDQLIAIRRYWYDIAMGSVYSAKVDGTKEDLLPPLRQLAQAGRRLWGMLFDREVKSAIYEIGQWLQQHPLERDSVVQVSVSQDATDFAFPWSLLYDHDVPKPEYQLPDPEGFWGVRYCVEQRLPKSSDDDDTPAKSDPQLRVAFMLWEQFRNAARQKALMHELVEECGGKLSVSDPPVTDALACYQLLADCEPNVLYFYTHGYTRLRESNVAPAVNLQLFLQWYEALPADSPARTSAGPLYESVKNGIFIRDRSWIGVSFGMIYLDELYSEVKELRSRPLVILNMCESAQVTPSLSDSFVDFFLDRGARSVIGTECTMTVEFADIFSESLFRGLLGGHSIGAAMLAARREGLARRNPLGLAYTLFGSASAAFMPAVLIEPAASAAIRSDA